MVREDLRDIPTFSLPEPYSLRWYRPGDEEAWVIIQRRADEYNEITLALFAEAFGEGRGELPLRQCFLCDAEGAPIGTATAWFNRDYYGRGYGRLHWVAILPEWQGRGLAKPLLTAVCKRMRELGPNRAYLTTATVRPPAVSLYFRFGFLPEIRDDVDREAWLEFSRGASPGRIPAGLLDTIRDRTGGGD